MPIKKLLLSFFVFCLIPYTSYSQEFHVSKSGDDANAGSENAPWESIQQAMDAATVGSTVYIHGGTYNERVYVNVSGSENQYITFKNYQNETVILDGEGLSDSALIEIYDVHHVSIEGLIIRNNIQLDASGILVEGACDHIRLKGNIVENIHFSSNPNAVANENKNAQPIIVYGSEAAHAITDLEIINNTVRNCRPGYSEALAVNGNVDGFVVSNNKVHDITNIGIDIIGHEGTCDDPRLDQARNGVIRGNEVFNCQSPYATAAGIYVDGGTHLLIDRNRLYNNQWGIEIGCENVGTTTSDITVSNNLVYQNQSAGIACGGYDYPRTGKVTDLRIVNNTLYDNDQSNDYTGEIYFFYTENCTLQNNIFYARNTRNFLFSTEDLTPSLNFKMNHNLWFINGGANIYWKRNDYSSLAAFTAATSLESNGLFADPQFVDSSLASPDLHLQADSVAVNAGSPSNQVWSGDKDFDGGPRIEGSAIDLGADEVGDGVVVVDPDPGGVDVNYPFPQQFTYENGAIMPNHHSRDKMDNDVRAFYDYWKGEYLVSAGVDGEGNSLFRIALGHPGSENYGTTVSEGQAYGMIITALMAGHDPAAKTLFDGLWRFADKHSSEIDPRLMAWRVSQDNPEEGDKDSAFDGDADIAFALLLADRQWGSNHEINYSRYAKTLIGAIYKSTIGPRSRLPMLGDWVDVRGVKYSQYTYRSSDFMLANFRAFFRFTHKGRWKRVVKRSIKVTQFIQKKYARKTGLLPDFIEPVSRSNHKPRPARSGFLEGENDGNYSYNACRVPLRIGMDALLNNDRRSKGIVGKISKWAKLTHEGNPHTVHAGYTLKGEAIPGSDDFSTAFVAPLGVAAMSVPSQQEWLNSIYEAVHQEHQDYFEDSVNLLSLLVMTGNFWDPTK